MADPRIEQIALPEALIFDLDGTLVDTVQDRISAWGRPAAVAAERCWYLGDATWDMVAAVAPRTVGWRHRRIGRRCGGSLRPRSGGRG
jgi:hypothetical protein